MFYHNIFLLSVLYCANAKEFCDSGEDCVWNVQSGFQVLDVASLEKTFCSGPKPCNEVAKIKGKIFVC